jgi:hypothetical protein
MALTGTFEDMSLAELLAIFRLSKRMGVLTLLAGDQIGVIYVRDGQLIDAFVIERRTQEILLRADLAVTELFMWSRCAFVFEASKNLEQYTQRITQNSETVFAITQVKQQRKIRSHALQNLLNTPVVLRHPIERSIGDLKVFTPDETRVLSLAMVPTKIESIGKQAALSPKQTVHLVDKLLKRGVLRLAPQHQNGHSTTFPINIPPAPLSRPLFEAIVKRVRGL